MDRLMESKESAGIIEGYLFLILSKFSQDLEGNMADTITLTIEAPAVKVLIRKLKDYPRELKKARERAMTRSTKLIRRVVKQKNVTPFKTGKLSRGWVIASNRASLGEIVNRVAYAGFVEKGTRRHVIFPKTKKALRFKPKGSAKFVFAKKVNHPGTKAVRMTKIALDKTRVRIKKIWQEELGTTFDSIEKALSVANAQIR